nr:reverse transcriptase domain-containing protein [Tanacetum cinerariifolium]
MAKEDEEKTTFITSQGVFCYSKMPFGLKNAEATYQHLVDKAFQKQMDKNMEVIEEGAFLGYTVNNEGITICPDEAAFIEMKKLIAKLPTLTAPMEREELIVYLASAREAVSAVLMTKREAKQVLAYFVSHALEGSHNYCHHGLANQADTAKTKGHMKAAKMEYQARFKFEATNNEAEYEALIAGLKNRRTNGCKNLQVNVDSRLVANQVLVEELIENSTNKAEVLAVVEEEEDTWMTPIYTYLMEGTLSAEIEKARVVRRKSGRYVVINGVLYRKSYLGPWLRCVGPLQANYVLREIHEGSCSIHAGTRFVVAKAIWTGYYSLAMHAHARKLIRACQDWQGIDIAGPFSKGPGKVKFLIVEIDYFTKWIEAKLVTTITSNQVKKFIWDNIVRRFSLSGEIISDNRKQFRDNPFKDWCKKLFIHQCFASVKYPQANGLVERANKSLGEGIKARQVERSNVIPTEIRMPTIRTSEVDMVQNDEALDINLDLLEERREQVAIREAKSKAKWKNIPTLRSATQASNLEISCTGAMSPAMQKRAKSLALSGKDHMK